MPCETGGFLPICPDASHCVSLILRDVEYALHIFMRCEDGQWTGSSRCEIRLTCEVEMEYSLQTTPRTAQGGIIATEPHHGVQAPASCILCSIA
jgi:hypothetical protein